MQQIATRVRAEVAELTKKAQPPHEQTPAYYDQLLGEFVLKAGAAGQPKSGTVPPAEMQSAADRMWAAVKDTASIAAFGSLSPAIRQGQPRLRPVGRGADRRAEAN